MLSNYLSRDRDLFTLPGVTTVANADLSNRTWMKTRSTAAILCTAHNPRGLRALVRLVRERDYPMMILGGGANTIFAVDYFEGIVLVLDPRGFSAVERTGPRSLTVGAATEIGALLNATRKEGLMGLEFLTMVPGTVGGALAGNAGAGNWGLCDFVESVTYMTRSGRVRRIHRGEFEYGYRHSELAQALILDAELLLEPRREEVATARQREFVARKKNQPYKVPSSGCIFKNPVDPRTGERVSAGMLIDQAALKRYQIEGATVSEDHANFIINTGNANGEDFLALISLIRDVVHHRFGIELEVEARIVGGPLTSCYLR